MARQGRTCAEQSGRGNGSRQHVAAEGSERVLEPRRAPPRRPSHGSGPTSRKALTPSDSTAAMASAKRTVLETCATQYSGSVSSLEAI